MKQKRTSFKKTPTQQKAIELWTLRLFVNAEIWQDYATNDFFDGDLLMRFDWMKSFRNELNRLACIFLNEKFLKTGELAQARLRLEADELDAVGSIKELLSSKKRSFAALAAKLQLTDKADIKDIVIDQDDRLPLVLESIDDAELEDVGMLLDIETKSRSCSTAGEYWKRLLQSSAVRKIVGEGCPSSLKTALRELDKVPADFLADQDSAFGQNLSSIQNAFGLTKLEAQTLGFLIAARFCETLNSVVNEFDFSVEGRDLLIDVAAAALGVERSLMTSIISTDSALHRTGLVCFPDANDCKFESYVHFLDCSKFCTLISSRVSLKHLFSSTLVESPAAELKLEDYAHIPAVERVLIAYVKKALTTSRRGVNILLYGMPGTGKTQLARLVAAQTGAKLYDVVPESDKRLQRWKTANAFLEHSSNTILAIDEAEDVFNEDTDSDDGKVIRRNKAELNSLLENSSVPSFWITNSIEAIDPAMIRRFDLVFEIPAPDAEGRRKIIDAAFAGNITDKTRERLVLTPQLAPAVMQRAASVARAVGFAQGAIDEDEVVSMIDEVLRAQDYGHVAGTASVLPSCYDPRFVNCDLDLVALPTGIRRAAGAKLCLYGPPGTGKSAYAAWIAKELNRPLVRRTVAELSSCYVGETEKLIAQAFREAKRQGAVLLIDEADSFLRDRKLSRASWETTQVNEMLAQLENFSGYFIATTNLLDSLDAASLRRFDLKAKFDFLKPAQALDLAQRHLDEFGLVFDDAARAIIARQTQLTPGDFAAVARQSTFRPLAEALDFAKRLAQEAAVKDPDHRAQKNPMGFS